MPTTDATQLIEIKWEDSVVVAFSGGVDSLALLILLSSYLPKERLAAVYVNHRLRSEEELAQEEQRNQANCQALGVPLHIVRLAPDEVENVARHRRRGIEEAARTLRYEALERVRQELGFSLIATAHTADDQAETLLMRLFQGSFVAGLRGIASKRGNLVRPILNLTRADVSRIVAERTLLWSEDSTNGELRFLRNRIRAEVVPAVAKVFPRYREALMAIAEQSRSVMEDCVPHVEQLFATSVIVESLKVSVAIEAMSPYADAVVELLLYRMWEELHGGEGGRLGRGGIGRLVRAIRIGQDTNMAMDGTFATIRKGLFAWSLDSMELAGGFVSLVYSERTPLDGRHVLVRGGTPVSPVPLEMRVRLCDADLSGTLLVRSARRGDRIDLAGGSTLLSDLFGSWKVKPQQRWRVPVLEDERGIVAVLGSAYGGRDRVARRCLVGTLARNDATLYSITDTEG